MTNPNLIAICICHDVINDMIQAIIWINIIFTTVDKILLAEFTSFASTLALVAASTDNLSLFAAVLWWDVDQGVVAKQNWAFGFIAGWIFQAKWEGSVITAFVISPVLGCKHDTFGHMCCRCNRNTNHSRVCFLGNCGSHKKEPTNNKSLHHFSRKKIN